MFQSHTFYDPVQIQSMRLTLGRLEGVPWYMMLGRIFITKFPVILKWLSNITFGPSFILTPTVDYFSGLTLYTIVMEYN